MHITFSLTFLILSDTMQIICLSPSLNRVKYTKIYTFSMDNVLMEVIQSHCQTVQILSLYLSSHIHLYMIQQPAAQRQAFSSLWCKHSSSLKFAFICLATICKELHIRYCHYTSVTVIPKNVFYLFYLYNHRFVVNKNAKLMNYFK